MGRAITTWLGGDLSLLDSLNLIIRIDLPRSASTTVTRDKINLYYSLIEFMTGTLIDRYDIIDKYDIDASQRIELSLRFFGRSDQVPMMNSDIEKVTREIWGAWRDRSVIVLWTPSFRRREPTYNMDGSYFGS